MPEDVTKEVMEINTTDSIPFEAFACFERITTKEPLLYCEPPAWAAAAHAIVVEDTVHYLWAEKKAEDFWVHMHSFAPVSDPAKVTHDSRNPILQASLRGFDSRDVEYPFPFFNPADGRYYMYYLGRELEEPGRKQTGLLVGDGDLGQWTRVSDEPVVAIEEAHEKHGCSHSSVVVVDDTIHMVYTSEVPAAPKRREILYNVPTICHATAPTSNPAQVSKNPANPIFSGSGQAWDCEGVREAEILRDTDYFHIFYGGYDGSVWAIGHVRTRDFHSFEPNPHNPIFTPSSDPEAWDSDGLLTPQVFTINGVYYMIYAGLKGSGWNRVSAVHTGLAVAKPT